MTSPDASPCPACGGRGWKFLSFRRSVASAGDASERALMTRTRVACLRCQIPPPRARCPVSARVAPAAL